MKLTIGSTTFDATRCSRRRDNTKGFYLDIEVPVESISKDALYDLLDNNKETIYALEDDGTESMYDGFNSIQNFSVSKGAIFVAQYCTSELEAQLSLANSKIAEQDRTIAGQGEIIAGQNEEIIMLNDILLEVLLGF